MTRFKLLSAAFIVSAGMATPVLAQPSIIAEPAFFYPNGGQPSEPTQPALVMAMAMSHSGKMARHGMHGMSHPASSGTAIDTARSRCDA